MHKRKLHALLFLRYTAQILISAVRTIICSGEIRRTRRSVKKDIVVLAEKTNPFRIAF